jgi:hypothetical protein
VALVSATVQARAMASSQLAQRLSAATLVAAATLVIVRDPVLARIGAVMPVIVVLAAAVLADAFPRAPDARAWVAARGGAWYRTGMVGLAIGITLALAASATVLARRPQLDYLSRWRVAELAESPPTLGLAPRYEPLVSYVRACTRPTDRVLATWFVPELYFYSGRAFAGGLPVMFGGHWSEDRFERHILRRLEAETVPLVIMRFVPRQVDVDYLREVWPLLSDYVARHYEVGATTDFGTKELTYQIWVRRGVVPANRYGPAGLPCYATAS